MSDDLIKRSDAIKAVEADFDKIDALDPSAGIMKACIRRAMWQIMGVPSADRPQEWIEDARTYYETLNAKGYFVDQHTPYFTDDIACPNCLAKFSTIDNETERFDYCPHCGCRMKGADDE